MVKVILYGDPVSTCTQRVMILLEELNLEYHLEKIDLKNGEQKGEEFLSLQPFGKVPFLKYDDRIIMESRSILRYIAKNNKDIEDLFYSTDVDIWLEVESQNFNPCASKIVYELVFKKWMGKEPDTQIVENSIGDLEKVLDVYEKRLSETSFLGGENFSIADISHIPYIQHLIKCGYKSIFKCRPNVYKWVKMIVKRDSVDYVGN
jgi:glutathione S-transferase